jgi:endoglucanase
MERLGAQPVAQWIAEWSGDPQAAVRTTVSNAAAAGRTAVLVAYNIPARDCQAASGSAGAGAYRSWIRSFAAGLQGSRTVVILEPDAIAAADCLAAAPQEERFALLRDAVTVLSDAGALVYLDAGHPRWKTAEVTATLLARAGVAGAQGFALNVSNFVGTAENAAYGEAVSRRIGGKHYVIDTSRNGLGPASDNAWCNPAGRAVGQLPTTSTGYPAADAFLWVKVPGESDGTCNGGPAAGQWWADYALGLAARSATL